MPFMVTFHVSRRIGVASSGRRKTTAPAATLCVEANHPRRRTYVPSMWYCGDCQDLRAANLSALRAMSTQSESPNPSPRPCVSVMPSSSATATPESECTAPLKGSRSAPAATERKHAARINAHAERRVVIVRSRLEAFWRAPVAYFVTPVGHLTRLYDDRSWFCGVGAVRARHNSRRASRATETRADATMSMQGVVVALGGDKRFGTLINEVRPRRRDRPPKSAEAPAALP